MKKMKLFLLAALLVGTASAFTTVKATKFTDAFGSEDYVNWTPVNQADEGITYDCDEGNHACLYNTEGTGSPIGSDLTKQFRLK